MQVCYLGGAALPPHQQDLLMGSGGERALCSLVRARGRGPEASAARCSAAASASVAEGNDWPRRSFGPNRGARYLAGGRMRRASPCCRRGVVWLDCELLGPAADTTGSETALSELDCELVARRDPAAAPQIRPASPRLSVFVKYFESRRRLAAPARGHRPPPALSHPGAGKSIHFGILACAVAACRAGV